MRELALGARLTLAGGRAGLLRTAITAVGVALGVAVLLVAASIPAIHDGRQARGAGPERRPRAASGGSAAACSSPTPTRASAGATSAGGCCRATSFPPGLARAPRAGRGVRLARAARRCWPRRTGGGCSRRGSPAASPARSAPPGCSGRPSSRSTRARATSPRAPGVRRLDHFGADRRAATRLNPILALLVVIVLVALLLPVAVLVGAAVRTGRRGPRPAARRAAADRRRPAHGAPDRRGRGADQRAAPGCVLGRARLRWSLRAFADHVSIWDTSVYPADVQPEPAARRCGASLGVPAAAVLVSLLALRRVVAEPLGRRPPRRGDAPPPALVAAAAARGRAARARARRRPRTRTNVGELRVAVGVIALLVGVAALLPWVVERVVGRLGAGKVAWQLAVRRLQLDPGGPARRSAASRSPSRARSRCRWSSPASRTSSSRTRAPTCRARRLYAAVRGGSGVDAGTPARGCGAARRRALGRGAHPVRRRPTSPTRPSPSPRARRCARSPRVTELPRRRRVLRRQAPRGALAFGATTWTRPAGAREVAHARGPDRARARAASSPRRPPCAASSCRAPYVVAFVRTDPARPDAVEHVRNAAAALEPADRRPGAAPHAHRRRSSRSCGGRC